MPENSSEALEPAAESPEAPAQESKETDWKSEARKWEQRAKDNASKLKDAEPIVSQWRQLEEASKTELQRVQEEATRWQTEASTWRTTAVSSRVETLASSDFADPSDAVTGLGDPAKYLDAGGQIQEEAIRADLAALLERKPHWRKADQAPAGPRVPAPNPAQGSGVNGKAAANPATEFAALLQGLRP
jgi:hypothetical protein